MDHLAILRRSSGALEKIVEGRKIIESRWYAARRAPWGRIFPGDAVFFKYSGGPVEARATVQKVLQYDLALTRAPDLLCLYGKKIGLDSSELPEFARSVASKRYCILVFLTKARRVRPFRVSKAGYGSPTAWVTIDDIHTMRIE